VKAIRSLTSDALRTRIMRNNRASGNQSTELRLIELMSEARISGWRRHSMLFGRPDFVFPKARVAVFVDGCFWHGCSCKRTPTANSAFWVQKVLTNRSRDRRVSRILRDRGWQVIRIWEHQLKKNPRRVLLRIARSVGTLLEIDRLA